MTKTEMQFEHPWQKGPSELISHALEHFHLDTEFDHRIAFLLLDVGVETLLKTFLDLPEEITKTTMAFGRRKAASGGTFHDVVMGVKEAASARIDGLNLSHIKFYHDIRNSLYHRGNGITVPVDKTKAYAELAVELLNRLLEVDLSKDLLPKHLRHPERNQLETQLEELGNKLQLEYKSFQERLPLVIEHIEPMVLMPSFSRSLLEWGKNIEQFFDLGRRKSEGLESDEIWSAKILNSMPENIKEFAKKHILPIYLNETLVVEEQVHAVHVYTSGLVELHIAISRYYEAYSTREMNFYDAAKLLQPYIYAVVAEQTFNDMQNLGHFLGMVNMFLSHPPNASDDEEELRILSSWLESRQESLEKIIKLKQFMSNFLDQNAQ